MDVLSDVLNASNYLANDEYAKGEEEDFAASEPEMAFFPTQQPRVLNRFTSQDDSQINEGYDLEGNLPHFADETDDILESYEEEALGIAPFDQLPPPPPLATIITVESIMKLGVKELREQLKLRGWATSGNKQVLQARLREAIEQNIPVSTTAAPPQHE